MMLQLPFFQQLEHAEHILLAGAGGGFDIFSGLPLYFALRSAGKQVHLANLSFSHLPDQGLTPGMATVTASTPATGPYFPELYLAQWLTVQGDPVSIYCFQRSGVIPLRESYETLVRTLNLDTVILVDGGTDSLMRGDEVSLGTPQEDVASIVAANALDVPRKLLVCLGFGIDRYHGICHADFLEAVAELIRSGGYLGMFSLMQEMPEVQRYREATAAVFQAMPKMESIVTSSIISALAGEYGDYHQTERTRDSTLWINPLMSAYWCFSLPHVAERLLYRAALEQTVRYSDITRAIAEFRERCPQLRPRRDIPV